MEKKDKVGDLINKHVCDPVIDICFKFDYVEMTEQGERYKMQCRQPTFNILHCVANWWWDENEEATELMECEPEQRHYQSCEPCTSQPKRTATEHDSPTPSKQAKWEFESEEDSDDELQRRLDALRDWCDDKQPLLSSTRV